MNNIFKYSNTNKRYHTLDYFYKNKFHSKVCKISLNAGFSCPNLDGTVGYGGCIYCSKLGSGEFAGKVSDNLNKQFQEVKQIYDKKWPNAKYIGYFQARTNTYAPVSKLKEIYESILNKNNVIGLNIATRPDSITDECLDYLSELNKKTYLTIELGLQSIHDKTAKLINRCCSLDCFEKMVTKLRKRNIDVVVHIINGLPYESKEMMLDTVRYLDKLKIDGIKIHMLNIIKGTKLHKMYEEEHFHMLSKEEYINIVCDQLELLSPEVVIHRITADPKIDDLIEPSWLVKKFGVLNDIDKELERRGTYQGFKKCVLNEFRRILDKNICVSDIVVDATVGNGNDTLYLANIVRKGYVYGFDIQSKAIYNTKKLLDDNNITNYTLFNKSHEYIYDELRDMEGKVSAIVYNLGYLPNGDKSIVTKKDSTIASIMSGIKLLNNKGFILVVVYPHDEGVKEARAILKLKIDGFCIEEYHNTPNPRAPYLIYIKRNK